MHPARPGGSADPVDANSPQSDTLRHVRFAGRASVPAAGSIGHRRAAAVRRARLPAAPPDVGPDPFTKWVFQRAGLDAGNYRAEPLQRRVTACLRVLRAHGEAEARRILEERPDLLPAAVSALLIGVTCFFRDLPVFEALRREIVPSLVARQRPLRIWSAGCANGAELYSVAILLAEFGALDGSYLLGSDCRHDAIHQARTGRYSSVDLRETPEAIRRACFVERHGTWSPVEALRPSIHWKVSDLAGQVEQGPWDMILWRNMAIYLAPGVTAAVWQRLLSSLTAEGVVVVGRAERPPGDLPLTCLHRCVYGVGRARQGIAMPRVPVTPRVGLVPSLEHGRSLRARREQEQETCL